MDENEDNTTSEAAHSTPAASATTSGGVKNGLVKVDEAAFRYPGPRPQSKEAAIVMLADTIEASARSLPNLSPEKLARHINAMIAQRLQEGELSECEVTLRDLGKIEDSFVHVLRGVLHHRIEYPDPKREFEKDKENNSAWVREALAGSFSSTLPEPNNGTDSPSKQSQVQSNGTARVTGSASSRRKRRRAAQNSTHAQEQSASPKLPTSPQPVADNSPSLPQAPSHPHNG